MIFECDTQVIPAFFQRFLKRSFMVPYDFSGPEASTAGLSEMHCGHEHCGGVVRFFFGWFLEKNKGHLW